MRYKKKISIGSAILFGCCIAFISNSGVFAQSISTNEKPKINNFGKSLKKFEERKKDNFKEHKKDNEKTSDATDEETIRVKTDLVVSEVLVVDRKGNAILDLKESDFIVTENDKPQKVEVFSFGDKVSIPRSIVLIIDYSGSQVPYLKHSIEAAKVLVDKLNPKDRMAIVTDDVKLLVDFTKDKALLKQELDSLYGKVLSNKTGKSEQFTALLAVLNEMFDEEDIRPIVILQSDGDELFALKRIEPITKGEFLPPSVKSRIFGILQKNYSYQDVYSEVSKSRATIYSIVPGFRFINRSPEDQLTQTIVMAQKSFSLYGTSSGKPRTIKVPQKELITWSNWHLKQQLALLDLTKISGGYLDYLEKPEDAEKVYSSIFAAMNNRYLIGYYATDLVQETNRRNVKIEVKGHPDYIVVGRKTYFVPEQEK